MGRHFYANSRDAYRICLPDPSGRPEHGVVACGNTDQPDLRAEEVATILCPPMGGCPIPGADRTIGSTKVEVLDGTAYPRHSQADRNVRAYVMAYLD
ncbi:MAG TPA: hypothetical protein VMA37_10980 [Acetobacteraceae bacterium]|nr:hypothetical protein [Acetobacteraceae bacterium]